MKNAAILCMLFLSTAIALHAQDVLGMHDLGAGGPGPVTGGPLASCNFCHATHSAIGNLPLPLWSQKLSTVQSYTLYTSTSMKNQEMNPTLGSDSNLCLSCHDGTVAPGQTTPYGAIHMNGTMLSKDVFGANLTKVHPFNFKLPLTCDPNTLLAALCSGSTGNPAVNLHSNVQCTTCHDPHVQNIDPTGNFLVIDNSSSALCLACHVSQPNQTFAALKLQASKDNRNPKPSAITATKLAGRFNPFELWRTSIHAEGAYRIARTATTGAYGTMPKDGCMSCHKTHDAPGGEELLAGPTPAMAGVDPTTQSCAACHSGGNSVSPAILNVFAEFAKTGHPFPDDDDRHVARESAVLNNNRHATCVDCHEPHASQQTTSFELTTIRPSQNGALGVSAADGTTVVNPAQFQYQTCLRCHGTSDGKKVLAIYGYHPQRLSVGGDPLNIIPQFDQNAASSHPVMHDSNSPLPQPSLRKYMLDLDGRTQGRLLGTRILCTDCHNSDDNREFGGTGPNGPHGSIYPHILARRYEFSQVGPGVPPSGGPGSTIVNLLPAVTDPTESGPYSLCAKCHDLSSIMSDVSFSKHSLHIKAGFSCSVCHTPHGMRASAANPTGERMVNFDLAVVGKNDAVPGIRSALAGPTVNNQTGVGLPIVYNSANNTCTLRCHNYNHNPDGTVTVDTGAGATARSTQP